MPGNFTAMPLPGRLPVVLQAERSECALACLAMVLGYHGHRIDLNTLRNKSQVSQHGMNLKSVIMLASKLHLAARPLKLELHELSRLRAPAVLHWDLNHFVILKKAGRNKLVIHNPASGRQVLDWREAGKHFTGVALEFLPTAQFTRKHEAVKLQLAELWRHTTGLVPGLVQLLVLSLLLQLFTLALPFYTQVLIDDVLVTHDVGLLNILATGFLLLTVIRQVTEMIRSYVVLHLGNSISFQFATRVAYHLLHLPHDYFARRHIGDVVSRFGSLNKIKDFFCSGIIEVLVDGLMVFGTLVLMFVYSRSLAALALVAVLLYALLRIASYRSFHARNEELINCSAVENTTFMENIHAIQGIKLFGKEADRLAGWQNCYADVINAGIRVQKLGIGVGFAHGLLVGVENIVILLLAAHAVLAGTISIGMVMAFVSFKDQFYTRVFSLIDKLFEFRLLDLHLGRLADIAFCEAESHGPDSLPAGPAKHSGVPLSLEHLSYRYGDGAPLLFQAVTLELERGECVAIIGPTGCGKSTLLKLVMSLLTPVDGDIRLFGNTARGMGLAAYRRQIGAVMQGDGLLSGSIAENISFFDTCPDHARIVEAASRAAVADDVAGMPMQYHTLVGSQGAALSGGQVQRILLARAFYKQPALLVLDEASSHLDLPTEHRVNRAIRDMGIPCLMVAHRPQSVLLADRIFNLTPKGLVPIQHGEFRKGVPENSGNDVITI